MPLSAIALLRRWLGGTVQSIGFPCRASIYRPVLPRFSATNGTAGWRIAPIENCLAIERRYRPGTLVLETRFRTASGTVLVIDFMPLGPDRSLPLAPDRRRVDLVRIVRGEQGTVTLAMELIFRFDYGSIVPWVTATPRRASAIAGPDAMLLRTLVDLEGRDETTVSEFTVHAGETVPCTLSWYPSHQTEPAAYDAMTALDETTAHWEKWSSRHEAKSEWREAELRSLLTLKALTYQPTGGIVAAPTTSLPEKIGGVRNWDYRFCWLRDATFTLYAFLLSGYREEAKDWREWLLRAVAGSPAEVQVMYGLAGERRLPEYVLPFLGGYDGSPARPDRQRRAYPAPDRHFRRDHRCFLFRSTLRHRAEGRCTERSAKASRIPGDALAGTGFRAFGKFAAPSGATRILR